MVCAKSNADPSALRLFFSRRSRKSVLVNLIRSLMERNNRVSNMVNQRFRLLIGNGLNFDFWFDNWIGKGDLKCLFPRIFALVKPNRILSPALVSGMMEHVVGMSSFEEILWTRNERFGRILFILLMRLF